MDTHVDLNPLELGTFKLPDVEPPELGQVTTLRESTAFRGLLDAELEKLGTEVRTTYPDWLPDFSLQSLQVLEQWFAQRVAEMHGEGKARETSPGESTSALRQLAAAVQRPENEDFASLARMVGLYVGEFLVQKSTGTEWSQINPREATADTDGPVVYFSQRPEPVHYSPVAMALRAWNIFGRRGADGLDQFFSRTGWVTQVLEEGEK